MHKKCLEEPLLLMQPVSALQYKITTGALSISAHLSLFLPVLPKMRFEGQRQSVCCNLPVHMLSQEDSECAMVCDPTFGLHLADQ